MQDMLSRFLMLMLDSQVERGDLVALVLQWFPISSRIQLRSLLLTLKALHGMAQTTSETLDTVRQHSSFEFKHSLGVPGDRALPRLNCGMLFLQICVIIPR